MLAWLVNLASRGVSIYVSCLGEDIVLTVITRYHMGQLGKQLTVEKVCQI